MKWTNIKSWLDKKSKEEETKRYSLVLQLLFIHCPIVFLSCFFLLNLIAQNLVFTWYDIILNILGAGCTYYLFVDLFEFVVKTIKSKEG